MSSSRSRSKRDEDDVYYSRGNNRDRGHRSRSRSPSPSHHHRRRSYSDRDRDQQEPEHRRHRDRDDRYRQDSDRRRRRSRSGSRDRVEGYHRDVGSSRYDRDGSHSTGDHLKNEAARLPLPIPTDAPAGISIKLGVTPPQPFKQAVAPKVVSTPLIRSTAVASIFNDEDEEEEEMPPEAKMKMKNVGRNTPTSAGPNSFGKTKMGFCNAIHIAERDLEEKQMGNK